jgi:hypothetical protein
MSHYLNVNDNLKELLTSNRFSDVVVDGPLLGKLFQSSTTYYFTCGTQDIRPLAMFYLLELLFVHIFSS